MKKLFFSLILLAVALTSCDVEVAVDVENDVENDVIDEVSVTIGVEAHHMEGTRGGETDMDSGLGAIDNFSDDEWALYDLRYILEIYDVTEDYINFDKPVRAREIQCFDNYQSAQFNLRLIPNREYCFVVWADIVKQGSQDDFKYNTTNLNDITRKGEASAMDECMDAYFVKEDIFVESGLNRTLTLTRPFGKVRVITTDVNELNIGTTPATVDVTFYNHHIFASLDAITGNAQTKVDTVTYSYNIAKDAPYTQGYDMEGCNQTLFADYIFTRPQSEGAQEINFIMTVKDEDGRIIRKQDFNTQIPLQRNHLTTIIGNLLTTSAEFDVLIDDNFSDENYFDYEDNDATVGADSYIYLLPNSNWREANARFAVYTWVNNDNKWVDMMDSDGDGIFEVLKSELSSNIIFCRMNPDNSDNNWDNKWCQTVDLGLPTDGNTLYTIANGHWDYASGSWSEK